VIHTVGPIYRGGRGEAEKLASCHRECIRLADAHALKSLSFPAISTGGLRLSRFGSGIYRDFLSG
jgi:O-acetyl-ADP-ribose deacetylase (regulator of RNase III)